MPNQILPFFCDVTCKPKLCRWLRHVSRSLSTGRAGTQFASQPFVVSGCLARPCFIYSQAELMISARPRSRFKITLVLISSENEMHIYMTYFDSLINEQRVPALYRTKATFSLNKNSLAGIGYSLVTIGVYSTSYN